MLQLDQSLNRMTAVLPGLAFAWAFALLGCGANVTELPALEDVQRFAVEDERTAPELRAGPKPLPEADTPAAQYVVAVAPAVVPEPAGAALVEEASASLPERLVLAVCPQMFREALEPWIERRQREGLAVKVIDSAPTAVDLKKAIAEVDTSRCDYVLLVGDSPLSPQGQPCDAQRFVPTLYRDADVTAPYQETKQLPGDFGYGDFDGSGLAQASVGRLPVKDASQLTSLIKRIIAYEDSQDFGRWRSRVDLVAGVGGFGPVIDGAIEMVAGGIITGSLPGFVRTRITHASPTSEFHPGIDQFTSKVLDNYQDGARFWVYAGHGWIDELDRVPSSRQGRPVLTLDDLPRLKQPHTSSPIALLLACYTGAFDATQDCLAERMLLCDEGPIAVLAGSRVTMPYGNAAAAMGLIHSVFHRKVERLGDAWRDSLVEMTMPAAEDAELRSRRMMIDGIASLLGGGSRIDDERREHMQLYNWLGDPTLRLNSPGELKLEKVSDVVMGQPFTIAGESPHAGKLTLEVHRRLGSPAATPPGADRYVVANETAIRMHEQSVEAGSWSCELRLDESPGESSSSSLPMIIKATLVGDNEFAAGSTTFWLRPSPKPASSPEPDQSQK